MTPTQDVFDLTLARPVAGAGGEGDGLVHLWWSAPRQGERLVQVYLDGELTDVSHSPDQRELYLVVDRARSHRVELLAVRTDGAEDVWRDHARLLSQWQPPGAGRVLIGLVRDERLPVDSRVQVAVDGQLADEGMMWPADEARGGFGGLFAVGDFGYDAATGPGLGVGELGAGVLGRDGTAWRWRPTDWPDGPHEVALAVVDGAGLPASEQALTATVAIDPLPDAASDLQMTDDWTLSWSL